METAQLYEYVRATVQAACKVATSEPVAHICTPGVCSFVSHQRNVFTCTKNPRNVHICGGRCAHLYTDKTDDTITCLLTSAVLVNSISMTRTTAVSWADQVHKGSGANAGGDDAADTSRRFVGSPLASARYKMTRVVSAFLDYLDRMCAENRAAIVRQKMAKYIVPKPMTYLGIIAAHAHMRNKLAALFDTCHAEFSQMKPALHGPILRLWHILFPKMSFTERRIVLFTLGLFIRLLHGCSGLWPRQRAFGIFGRRVRMLVLAGRFTAKGVQSRALQVLYMCV